MATRPASLATPLWVAGVSAGLHVLAIAAIIYHGHHRPPPDQDDTASVQVEYVHQDAQIRGASTPDETAEPALAPTPEAAPAAAVPPPPSNPFADVPMPPPAPASNLPEGDSSRPADVTGTAPADLEALSITGQDVVSSGPDAAYRNMPPHYPRDAVRNHQQGSVQVTIHITPDGIPDRVVTVISSGSPVLDKAVRDAVLTWHFKPVIHDGKPVESVYRLQMNFRSQSEP